MVLTPLAACQDQEPTHAGKSARYWVDRLAAGHKDAEEAVLAIGPHCIPRLIERFPEDGFSSPAWRVEFAIRRMGSRAAPALLRQLRAGKARHRLLALSFLLELEERPKQLAVALPALLTDEDPEIRRGAAFQLARWEIFLPEAVPTMLQALKDESPRTRADAASILGRFPAQAESIVPALTAAIGTGDEDTILAAYGSLGPYWGIVPVVAPTVLEASRSKDHVHRVGAARAFGGVPTVESAIIDHCLRLAGDADPYVQREAVRSLRYVWVFRQVPLGENRRAFTHDSPQVRQLACEAAVNSDNTAKKDLLALIEDEHTGVRRAAISAVRVIGDESEAVGAALVGVLWDRRVASQAAWTLLHLRTRVEDAVRYLVCEMQDTRSSGRADRVNEIAGLGPLGKVALPALRKELRSTYAMTKMEAAWAVYTVGGDSKTSVAVVKASLQEEDRFNIIYAAWVACRLGPVAAEAAPLLIPILKNEDYWIRRNAALALGYLGPDAKPAIPQLRNMLNDRDTSTGKLSAPCFAAAASLARLGAEGPEIAKLVAEILEERDNLGGLEPAALRYAWRRGMPAKDVVERIVARAEDDFSPYPLHSGPHLIRLLGDMGPAARAAIPTLQQLRHRRYEIRTAADDALRRIQD